MIKSRPCVCLSVCQSLCVYVCMCCVIYTSPRLAALLTGGRLVYNLCVQSDTITHNSNIHTPPRFLLARMGLGFGHRRLSPSPVLALPALPRLFKYDIQISSIDFGAFWQLSVAWYTSCWMSVFSVQSMISHRFVALCKPVWLSWRFKLIDRGCCLWYNSFNNKFTTKPDYSRLYNNVNVYNEHKSVYLKLSFCNGAKPRQVQTDFDVLCVVMTRFRARIIINNFLEWPKQFITRNPWQSLANSPLGIVVSSRNEYLWNTPTMNGVCCLTETQQYSFKKHI